MRETFAVVTPEQMEALRAYAAREGRDWKQELSFAWMNASEPGYLQQLRNSHGPSWLRKFKFPEVNA